MISMKLSIVKKITGLEIMTLNRKKIWHVSRLIELMFKGELHSLQGCFRKQTGREDVYTLFFFLKLNNPKHEGQVSVRNESLSLNLLICWTEICKQRVC